MVYIVYILYILYVLYVVYTLTMCTYGAYCKVHAVHSVHTVHNVACTKGYQPLPLISVIWCLLVSVCMRRRGMTLIDDRIYMNVYIYKIHVYIYTYVLYYVLTVTNIN